MLRPALCAVVLCAGLLGFASPETQAALVSHWKFDEGSGQTPQDSVGTNHGTLGANASAGTDDPTWAGAGKIGANSLNFDGVNDFVHIGSPASLDVTAVTMTAWVNLDTTKRHAVLDKTSSAATGSGLHMRVGNGTSDDLVRGFVGNISPANIADSTSSVPLSPAWSHVALTSTSTTLKIYINGLLEDTVALSSPIVTNTSPFRIGNSSVLGNTYALDGRVDDAGFWNTALLDQQIRAIYTLGNEPTLGYDLSQAQQLFNLYAAEDGFVDINGERWFYTEGLSTGLGNVTQVGLDYYLMLNADGTGVTTFVAPIPEPNSGLLIGLGAVGLVYHRRKKALRNRAV